MRQTEVVGVGLAGAPEMVDVKSLHEGPKNAMESIRRARSISQTE